MGGAGVRRGGREPRRDAAAREPLRAPRDPLRVGRPPPHRPQLRGRLAAEGGASNQADVCCTVSPRQDLTATEYSGALDMRTLAEMELEDIDTLQVRGTEVAVAVVTCFWSGL